MIVEEGREGACGGRDGGRLKQEVSDEEGPRAVVEDVLAALAGDGRAVGEVPIHREAPHSTDRGAYDQECSDSIPGSTQSLT